MTPILPSNPSLSYPFRWPPFSPLTPSLSYSFQWPPFLPFPVLSLPRTPILPHLTHFFYPFQWSPLPPQTPILSYHLQYSLLSPQTPSLPNPHYPPSNLSPYPFPPTTPCQPFLPYPLLFHLSFPYYPYLVPSSWLDTPPLLLTPPWHASIMHAKGITPTNLLRQFDLLPRPVESCGSNLWSHPTTAHWHWVRQTSGRAVSSEPISSHGYGLPWTGTPSLSYKGADTITSRTKFCRQQMSLAILLEIVLGKNSAVSFLLRGSRCWERTASTTPLPPSPQCKSFLYGCFLEYIGVCANTKRASRRHTGSLHVLFKNSLTRKYWIKGTDLLKQIYLLHQDRSSSIMQSS